MSLIRLNHPTFPHFSSFLKFLYLASPQRNILCFTHSTKI